jgi:hypothetical protein
VYFVIFVVLIILGSYSYFIAVCQYLKLSHNQSAGAFLCALPLQIHAFLVGTYALLLLLQQYEMIFNNLTTNEKINQWRYSYLKDEEGQFLNPFDQGKLKNFLSFFRILPEKQPTIYYHTQHGSDSRDGGEGSNSVYTAESIGVNHGHSHAGGDHNHGRRGLFHGHSHGKQHHGHSH